MPQLSLCCMDLLIHKRSESVSLLQVSWQSVCALVWSNCRGIGSVPGNDFQS